MRVLLLSATTGYQLRSFNEAAGRAEVELLFATDRCHQLDDPWQDRAIAVRFHEPEASLRAIVDTAASRPLDGAVAVGDRPAVLAAHVASALGLPGNPVDAAAAAGNKRLTRERLHAAGLPAPWFTTVPLDEALDGAAPDLTFPCVLKPLGLSGSRGVIRANSVGEACAAFERIRALLLRPEVRALRTGVEDAVLVEGYIEGAEYALEGVLTGGRLTTLAIFDKPDPLEGPFFEETIYLTPSALGAERQVEAAATIEAGARAIGLCHGPVHAEFRVGASGVFVLEIAPRPIGGLCSKVLRFDEGRLSLEDVLLRHAAGQDVRGIRRETAAAGVMMIPIAQRGLLKRVQGIDDASQVPGVEEVRITAKTDQLLEPLPEAGSYLGFIFARGKRARSVDAALREAHSRLRFVVEPPIAVIGSP